MIASDASLFDEWYPVVHRQLAGALVVSFGDLDLAQEAADEALARACERWSRVSVMESPKGWTFQVGFNVARRKRRRRAMERRIGRARPVDVVPGPAGELWHLVRELPERQRTAVALRHVAQMTEADIGLAMGVTRGTISATLRQAYRSLRSQLADEPEPTEATA